MTTEDWAKLAKDEDYKMLVNVRKMIFEREDSYEFGDKRRELLFYLRCDVNSTVQKIQSDYGKSELNQSSRQCLNKESLEDA